MMQLKQLFQLHHEKVSKSEISKRLGISRNTVKKYLLSLESSGFGYHEVNSLSDSDLLDLFDNRPANQVMIQLLAYFPQVEKELNRVGVTRYLLWQEFSTKHEVKLSYARFCDHYRNWSKQSEATLHIEHKFGDKVFVDYTGKKLYVTDKETGEIQAVEVFVSILGGSQLIYAEASKTQQKHDFISSVENSLCYYQGVPRAIVTDNLMSSVTKANKYEPILNEDFLEFANHYQTTILPTRSYKPKDKALVEGAVKIVYQKIYAPLRNETFFTIGDLNLAIKEKLEILNHSPFTNKEYSRRQRYEETEKKELCKLPSERFVLTSKSMAKVQKNTHVWMSADKHYYSVPYKYIGQNVKLIYSDKTVEIYDNHFQRIACHNRNKSPHNFTTQKSHLPSQHQFVSDWNPNRFVNWASAIGEDCKYVIEKILAKRQHPEQSYKICIGILGMAKKYGNIRLNKACARAIYYERYNYHIIRNILLKNIDQLEDNPDDIDFKIPLHNNIRDASYYSK